MIDSTLALLREGYEFIPRRCRQEGVDSFQTRVFLQKVVCMSGEDAARVFYGSGRFTRRRAVPRPTLTLLLDFGSVQRLDGAAHRQRKQMFMKLMTREGIGRLADSAAREWRTAIDRWEPAGRVVLNDEVEELLCRAVCRWAGVPLGDSEAGRRARDLAAMFDGAGSFGLRQVRGQLARTRGERWIAGLVRGIRVGRLQVAEGSAAETIASHRELDGRVLDERVAAVELINILRPTVAVARFVTFAALALHEHPAWRDRLRIGSEDEELRFVHEVRRMSPFFPLVTGRAKEPFEWRGQRLERGAWVMLDLYGTNRDPRRWDEPDRFEPDRFREWEGSPFDFIPQGGGAYLDDHRCAGEWATIELMKVAVRALTSGMAYDVPDQDLRVRLSRVPAIPRSRFVIENVRRMETASAN